MARIYTPDGYAILGYFRLRSEAMTALMIATAKTPEPPQSPSATLSEIYQMWSIKHFSEISPGAIRSYKSAWQVLESIQNRPIRYITVSDIESAVQSAHASPTAQNNSKTLLNQLYATAMRYELVNKDISALININVPVPPKVKRKIFTFAEVTEMFERQMPIDQAILVGIYSGMRPCELVTLSKNEIDIEGHCFCISGSKTESGYNRTIPIHPAILSIITKLLGTQQKTLFRTNYGNTLNYTNYLYALKKLGHTPHDTRHSFATYAKKSKLDRLAIKRIMGHRVDDVTEAVYTHIDLPFLLSEMQRFAVL